MRRLGMNSAAFSDGQRGGARTSFVVIVFVLVVLGYAAYLYAPVAYEASLFKQYMQETVNNSTFKNNPSDWASAQLRNSLHEYGIPQNAVITVEPHESRIEARVQYTEPIQFPGFTYNYTFDFTARSSSFLLGG